MTHHPLVYRVMLACLCVSSTAVAQRRTPLPATSMASAAVGSQTASVSDSPLNVKVSVDLRNVPLRVAIDELRRQSGVQIIYSRATVPAERAVTLRGANMTLGTALQSLLSGTDAQVQTTRDANVVLVPTANTAPLVQGVITGKVVNANTKQPIANATVMLDGATKGVQTASDGTFRMPIGIGEHTVHVRAVGYARGLKRVTVSEGQNTMAEFQLEPSASVLDEMIVTGTVVSTERKAIPTPITVVTADDIEKRGITRVEQLFRGEIPGIFAQELGSAGYSRDNLGGMVKANVYTRGASTTGGGATPLKTYVDGVEILDPSYLGTIDPKSIERIEIVTGPQAATVYGSGAMGGVMQIFTKKGNGRSTPDVTLTLRYGAMQSNLSNKLTPAHNDALNLAGGTGPEFSYSGNLTYNYTGAWQPYLFNRMFGASVGATHTRGPFTASGSVSTTGGKNGTFVGSSRDRQLDATGQWSNRGGSYYLLMSRKVSTSSSQTTSLNVDYRMGSFAQHHLTVGRSQTSFALEPQAPVFREAYDSLYYVNSATGQRTTASYTTSLAPQRVGVLSSNLTLGLNGSNGTQTSISGSKATKEASSFAGSSVSMPLNDTYWGGFGSVRLGVFDKLYLTVGLRGERNPNYGSGVKFAWTPSNGLAYTMEAGDLTIKLLGSYGRSTRAPAASQRLSVKRVDPNYDPAEYVSQLENEDLTPEFSRGPQGGIELYYGNRGSITVNHYQQKVTDLIRSVTVDSIERYYYGCDCMRYTRQSMYMNLASVRQLGWETTANLNIGPVTLKGAYSFADSRVISMGRGTAVSSIGFIAVPTHTGSITTSYARGGTAVSLVTNFVGQQLSYIGDSPYNEILSYYSAIRIKYDANRATSPGFSYVTVPGYAKSDLNVSHRLTPWMSFVANVTNLGNSFGQEQTSNAYYYSALGRITTMGLSMRFPRTR